MSPQKPNQHQPQQKSSSSTLVKFVEEWGWRAYAIPVMAVITIWVLVDVFVSSSGSETTTAQTGTSSQSQSSSRGSGPVPTDGEGQLIDLGNLPPGGNFTKKGLDKYRPVGVAGPKVGVGKERTFKYRIEIEQPINTNAYGGDDGFVSMVNATLASPKGWLGDEKFAFQATNPRGKDADFVVQLASTETVHAKCGYDIELETSCYLPSQDESQPNLVILNESRWVRGASTFQGDLGAYRQYMVNHEVGHAIGYANHEACQDDGKLAPIMMQQTLSLSNKELHKINPDEVYPDNDNSCRPNPWPYPFK